MNMKRAIKTLAIFLSAIFLTAGCSSSDEENEATTIDETKPPLSDFQMAKDYRIIEEDLSKPPYSDGFTTQAVHQVPLAQMPDWINYIVYIYGNAIINRSSLFGEYIYNINNIVSSSYGNFYDSEGHFLDHNRYYLSKDLDWELVCITHTESIEDYDAVKEMYQKDAHSPLSGLWAFTMPTDHQQYWYFEADGTGKTYFLENSKPTETLHFLYSAEKVTLASGRKLVMLKMAFEKQGLLRIACYEIKDNQTLIPVVSPANILKKVSE